MTRPWTRHYDRPAPEPLDIPERGVSELLAATAGAHPDWVAVSTDEADTSYADLAEQVDRFAAGLAGLGIRRGDRVALMLPNSLPYVIAAFSAMKLGAIIVNLPVMTKGSDLAVVLRRAGARVLVSVDVFLRALLRAVPQTEVEQLVLYSMRGLEGHRDLSGLARPPVTFGELLASGSGGELGCQARPDDVAVLQLTGGTTRHPKVVALTHRNIIANITQITSCLRPSKPDNPAVMCVLPFFHIFGFTIALVLPVLKGQRMVLVPRFDPFSVVPLMRLVEQYRPLSFPAVPALWAVLVKYAATYQEVLASIEMPSSGGAPLPKWVQDEFFRLTGRHIAEAYGLSEATTTHMTPLEQPFRPASIGVPLPDTDARIVDLETGQRRCAIGEIGELVIKGPQVMAGYWTAEQTIAAPPSLRDGWLYTGDVARMDEDGYFYVLDRKDDLIITNGFNVCPSDVEAVLREHPAVADAAVIGLPDRIRGQALEAVVVLAEGQTARPVALLSHCARLLADYKVPRGIEIATSIPKSPVGTPLRRVLKQARVRGRER